MTYYFCSCQSPPDTTVLGGTEMPFAGRRPTLTVSERDRVELDRISRSRSESISRLSRAKVLLRYCDGESISGIARTMDLDRPKVDRTIAKAFAKGVLASLD